MINPELLDQKQTQCLQRMMEDSCPNVFIAWWLMGTGKTRLALAAFENSGFRDLIVVCRRISFLDWVAEMEKMGLDYLVYANDYKMKSAARIPKNLNAKRVLLVSGGDLKNIPDFYPKGQMLVVDELYLFSNPKARRTILLNRISLFCSVRLGLSGTIMPAQDNMTIYGQLFALGASRFLAKTATEFRTKFQSAAKGRFGREYTNRPGANDKIAKILSPMVDLHFPERRPTRKQILSVTKTKQQASAIRQLEEEYEFGNREYEYALQIVNVVNGISNGWWVDAMDRVHHLQSTKLEKLSALLDELVMAGERVVVWCAYHNDIARIASELKHPWLEFTARVDFDRKRWATGKDKIILATEANGASVNHFGQVKYAIYYSLNFKLLDLQQSMMRHERKDSMHDGAHYYFLQTAGTMDARAHYLVTQSEKTEKDLVLTLKEEMFK